MLYGRDVSNHQGKYDWAGVIPKPGFGFAKATEGVGFVDSYLPWNWGEMRRLGILRGAYHFGHPGEDAAAQAELFVNTVRKAGVLAADDVLVLDLEVTDGLGPSEVAAWAVQFCDHVDSLTGKNTWVYTDRSFIWNGCCAGLYARPLWIASPGNAGAPGSVAPWPVWSVQQYGADSSGVDVDVLNGDASVWSKLANATVKPPVYKIVPAKHICDGKQTMTELVKLLGAGASTLLRMSCEHNPNGLFSADLAGWLDMTLGGSESHVEPPLPKGAAVWYPSRVKIA